MEVSRHNTGTMYYSGHLLFIALSTHSFTTLEVGVECKCCICFVTVLSTKVNCIWYLHFYGIKLEFMGLYIQNALDLDFRVPWLISQAVLLKKKKRRNCWFFRCMNVPVVTAVVLKDCCFSSHFNEIQDRGFSQITALEIKCQRLHLLLRKALVLNVLLVDS